MIDIPKARDVAASKFLETILIITQTQIIDNKGIKHKVLDSGNEVDQC